MHFINKPFDKEERELMKITETVDLEPVSPDEEASVMEAIRTGKDRTISLRMNSHDLEKLKLKAESAGIPYQTLINTILHRYISGGVLLKDPL